MADQTQLFLNAKSLWDCPVLDAKMIIDAERKLRHKLPMRYLDTLREKNGGLLRRTHFPKYLPYLDSPISVSMLFGIGGAYGLDSDKEGMTLSNWLIRQWGYPDNCVVFAHFGTTACLFEYQPIAPDSEPRILHAYSDCPDAPVIETICDTFAEFVSALRSPTAKL